MILRGILKRPAHKLVNRPPNKLFYALSSMCIKYTYAILITNLRLRVTFLQTAECSLISEFFSLWLKSPKKVAKSQPWASLLYVDSAQGRFWHLFWTFESKWKKLSEIKPPSMGNEYAKYSLLMKNNPTWIGQRCHTSIICRVDIE